MASILPSRRDMRLEKEPAASAALDRGWRAALAYVLRREHLRRTVDGIARGDATAITWIKCGANFVIPFTVSNLGLLSGHTFARPEGLTSVR
jgi:hypothetical protein